MRSVRGYLLVGSLLVGCGGGDGEDILQYGFAAPVTACETAEWAQEHAALLASGDTAEAGRFASIRCFRVEEGRRVRIVDSEGRFPWSQGPWVEVASVDEGAPLEHLASAELRRALAQPPRTRGWVSRDVLEVLR
ncbi:MAG: hypothetical protein R3304_09565 [Longimicrobiales bacterium]|nr:hypothetical protein [Longimicrobiales bacterium]